MDLHIKTMHGWGDNIYIRPLIKHLAKSNTIYLETVLPDLYRDIKNVKFIEVKSQYRTQAKHSPSDKIKFTSVPPKTKKYEPFYTGEELQVDNIVSILMKQLDIPLDTDLEWDLPNFHPELKALNLDIPLEKKIAIVRPATIRKEWPAITRAPEPTYIGYCSAMLMNLGYHVISVADLEKDKEWLHGGVDVAAHQKFYKGEINMYALLELMGNADIVVGGPGFIVPASVSSTTSLFTIFGGRMGFDSPAKLFHPTMDFNKIGWTLPTNPCRCTLDYHDCNKMIGSIDGDFIRFLGNL